jgi:hypothetical protein
MLAAKGIRTSRQKYFSLMDSMKDGLANGINGEKGLLRHPGEAEEKAHKLRVKDELRSKYLGEIRKEIAEGNIHEDKEQEWVKEIFGPEVRYLDEGRDLSVVKEELDKKTKSFIARNQRRINLFG